jgi:hypothetical protein
MPNKLQHIDTLSERHFNWIKWSLTAVSTVVTSVFIQILHAGNL